MCNCVTKDNWTVVKNEGQWKANHHGLVCKHCGKHKSNQIWVPKTELKYYIKTYGIISHEQHCSIRLGLSEMIPTI